jgi:hypothetical protein
LIQTASALATPATLSAPSADVRAQVKAVGDAIQASLGKEDALYLLYRLGPADGTFVSQEPLSLKASNWVRAKFALLAMAIECDCAVSWGCDGWFTNCRANTGCSIIDTWPACGWLWDDPCDGQCRSIFAG